LCIGVNYPNDYQYRLNGCVSDACNMACLAVKMGVPMDHINLMIDEVKQTSNTNKLMEDNVKSILFDSSGNILTNKGVISPPTRNNVLNAITQLCGDSSVSYLFYINIIAWTQVSGDPTIEIDGLAEAICSLDDNANFCTKMMKVLNFVP
jgi:hypothetical protein